MGDKNVMTTSAKVGSNVLLQGVSALGSNLGNKAWKTLEAPADLLMKHTEHLYDVPTKVVEPHLGNALKELGANFNTSELVRDARLAFASYSKEKTDQVAVKDGYEVKDYIVGEKGNAVAVLAKGKERVIAFKGSKSLNDLQTDFTFYYKDKGDNIKVHSGFGSVITEKMYTRILSHIPADADVTVTGHSLGGALAQDFAFRFKADRQKTPTKVATFASPRLGNQAFADEYISRLGEGNMVRVENSGDPVPGTGPIGLTPTVHAGKNLIFLRKDGKLEIGTGPEKPARVSRTLRLAGAAAVDVIGMSATYEEGAHVTRWYLPLLSALEMKEKINTPPAARQALADTEAPRPSVKIEERQEDEEPFLFPVAGLPAHLMGQQMAAR